MPDLRPILKAIVVVGALAHAGDAQEWPSEPRDKLLSLSKEFREIVIQAATEPQSEMHAQALAIVQSRNWTDPRLDDFIRQMLRAEPGESLDRPELSLAVTMLLRSGVARREQVKLLLDLLVLDAEKYVELCGTSSTMADLKQYERKRTPGFRSVIGLLGALPEEAAAELSVRLWDEDAPAILFAAARLTGEHGATVLPALLDRCKHSDGIDSVAALMSADTILQAAASKAAASKDAASKDAGVDPAPPSSPTVADDRLLEYAERIVRRYDANKNGALERVEWGKLLQSPASADRNGDGRITTLEYAAYLHSRQR